jgi:hypothetical protein
MPPRINMYAHRELNSLFASNSILIKVKAIPDVIDTVDEFLEEGKNKTLFY